MQTCHIFTAQLSTNDMFWLIELYGRKVQSVVFVQVCLDDGMSLPGGSAAQAVQILSDVSEKKLYKRWL